MTQAQAAPPTKPRSRIIRRERPIIERPRLIKKLDACEARTILLLAPAGYGKTTLARQWAKTLSRVVWVSLTSAHRDVTVLARDLARSIEDLGDDGFVDFMDQYLSARQNPQREAREIGLVLAEALNRARVQWIVFDDYHELAGTPDAERLVEAIANETDQRLLVSSRIRPTWATNRAILYGNVSEIGQPDLAMDEHESLRVVGRAGQQIRDLLKIARGWPAVLGLAARVDVDKFPIGSLPDSLHSFLVEEFFALASREHRESLTELALLPAELFDNSALPSEPSVDLLLDSDGSLHPLIQEFLLLKLEQEPECKQKVESAVERCLTAEAWQRAFELIARFGLHDLVDRAITLAYKPLVRTGRLWTLQEFVVLLRSHNWEPSPLTSVVDAEAAFSEGRTDLALQLATGVLRKLPPSHSLTATAALIQGHSALSIGDYVTAESGFRIARETAADQRDLHDAIYARVNLSVVAETDDFRPHLEAMAEIRDISALDLARYGIALTNSRRISTGHQMDGSLEESLHALHHVRDPKVSTSLRWTYAYALLLQARYLQARELLAEIQREADAFRLAFVTLFSYWLDAALNLGLRDFGACKRALQRAERHMKSRPSVFHELNVRTLTARMYLQTGRFSEALDLLDTPPDHSTFPSMRAEYLATRAIALACLDRGPEALRVAAQAEDLSMSVESRVLAAAAQAVTGAQVGQVEPVVRLFELAEQLSTWDPVVCALRASVQLVQVSSADEVPRRKLQDLCQLIDDRALARQANVKIRPVVSAQSALSKRELEILGLIGQGMRNAEIAKALFISESTVKVHVRHILDKLHVRTRAQAAALL